MSLLTKSNVVGSSLSLDDYMIYSYGTFKIQVYRVIAFLWKKTTLNRPNIVGHNDFLEPTLVLIMRINMATLIVFLENQCG